MATPSNPHRWRYDVFVSFRGEDVRKSFIDHLFNDFNQKGIHAFRDDNELPKGEEISSHICKAIEESRFLIVVFSKNYATSTWCLRELVKIIECKQIENPKHEVRIIFYDAKPDVVRKQKLSYAKAFGKHEVSNSTEVGKWKEALSMAANLSGWDFEDMTNGYESKFIDCISKEILIKLCDGPLHVGENLVGIDINLDKLDLSRFVGSDKVNMFGVSGISGIGKTTLAKAIYNLMHVHFDGSCFCEGVSKQQGVTQVQMQIIGKIIKTENMKISSVAEGAMVIKQRMSCKRVLLVLDDVDDHEQLEALAGSPTWFCPGSLIIFTCKDKQLLRSHRVDEIHDMKFLDEDKSLEIFYSYAFEEKNPSTGFKEVSKKVVKYVKGHPLALKVLGRFLYGKTVGQWESELERLKVHPNEKIQRVLRLSYDGLNLHQQNILLDIACLFIGEKSDFAARVLDGCNFFAETNMRVLVDKSLITISSNTLLQMHDLIQAMARAIVHEESIMPGKQRRLCISSAIYDVKSEKKVEITEAVEVLVLMLEKSSHKFNIDATDFAHMNKLRILKIYQKKEFAQEFELASYNVIFSGSLYFLSNELRLFCWHGYPFKYLPSNFYPENIIVIDLSYSNIKNFWTTPKCFRRLKVMKLRYCCNLATTPDFSKITNLEELSLEGCVNLVSVHPSIGLLKRLVVLNLRDCKRLQKFPSRVEMDALQVLNLTGCLKIDQLPEALGRIKSLMELHVDRTAIIELPSFVPFLRELESLSFGGQRRIQPRWWTSITGPFGLQSKQQHPQRSVWSSLEGLHMLKSLNLSYCNLEQVPDAIGDLSFLKKLQLEGNNFTSLPGSLSQFSHLSTLYLNGCKKLQVLPELPPSLQWLNASDCTSLREVPGSSKHLLRYVVNIFRKCPNLFKNNTVDSQVCITSQGSIHQLSAFLGFLGLPTNRFEFFHSSISTFHVVNIVYHGNVIPEWFTNTSTENHLKVELPSDLCCDNFRGHGACVVFKCKKPRKFEGYTVKYSDGASFFREDHIPHVSGSKGFWEDEVTGIHESYMIWFHYTVSPWIWRKAKNFVTFSFQENNEDVEVKEFGVRLICNEDLEHERDVSVFHGLPTPTQHGGFLSLGGPYNTYGASWSW